MKVEIEKHLQLQTKIICINLFSVISTWKEPIAGWTDKAFAPTSIVKSLILGYCSSILCTDNLIIDMVPGDFAVNALIAIAWDIHTR